MTATRACVLGLMVLVSSNAAACRCAGPLTPSAAYAEADQVVLGKTLEVNGDLYGRGGAQVQFGVLMAWKGNVPESVQIESSTTCAFPFEAGAHYLLYLQREPGGSALSARSCMGSAPAGEAGRSLEWLRLNGEQSSVPPR